MADSGNWSDIWSRLRPIEYGKEPYMWRFYDLLLGGYDFRGKRVLEMGCGTGINTILMAKRGAKVTFMDFSKDALDVVERNMARFGVDGELVLGDITEKRFESEFDIVHSEGVIEHFRGPMRQGVVDMHSMAARKGGRVVIIVPQVWSLFYRFGKALAELTGSWVYGHEYPYTRFELEKRLEKAGLSPESIAGGELFMAFGWLFSALWLRDGSIMERSISRPANETFFRLNYNNWAANRWGRVLGTCAVKD